MIVPVRCFTCGCVIGNKWKTYVHMVEENKCSEQEVLDKLLDKRYCCRRMLLTHVDIIDKLLAYTKELKE